MKSDQRILEEENKRLLQLVGNTADKIDNIEGLILAQKRQIESGTINYSPERRRPLGGESQRSSRGGRSNRNQNLQEESKVAGNEEL